MPKTLRDTPRLPAKLGTVAFIRDFPAHFRWMHAHGPVCRARISVIKAALVCGYEDCRALLRDPRVVRDRRKAGGKSKGAFPVPRSVQMVLSSMIDEDEPEHLRLRSLVAKVFTPRAIGRLASEVEVLTGELLDAVPRGQPFDLVPAYSLPIPVTVIRSLLGVEAEDMPRFMQGVRMLSRGYNVFTILMMILVDLPRIARLLDTMIERKRAAPQDDMLSALIAAEEAGDKLSHEELLSMAFLLIGAGYETTVHFISNSVLTLLRHPRQLGELRESLDAGDELLDAAVEELLRYAGPVQSTKPAYVREALLVGDVELPRGTTVVPCIGAANRDPAIWDEPDRFDIHRPQRKNLGFGFGAHACIGAALARLETKIALRELLRRFDTIELAVAEAELEFHPMPLWLRYKAMPLRVS